MAARLAPLEAALEEALPRGAAAARPALARAGAALDRLFDEGVPATVLLPYRALLLDRALRGLWRRHLGGPGEAARAGGAPRAALVAVGGYGRGELHPHSDVDVLVLVEEGALEGPHAPLRAPLEAFLTELFDLGPSIGHSVRSPAQCAEEAAADLSVATNLMEARLLAGPAELFQAMREATAPARLWPSDAFFQAKRREQEARHHRFHDTAYNLEPHLKEGPGGLRDLQTVAWVAHRHFGTAALRELVERGFLTETEHRALVEARAFLWQVRYALHLLAGRREDRLLFDHQPALAARFGYRDGGPNLAVEQFMKRYYRTVAEIGLLNELLLQLFEQELLPAPEAAPRPLGRRFRARRGYLEASRPDLFARYPFAMLEAFLLLQQHPELRGLSAGTVRALRQQLHRIDQGFRRDLRARSLFMEILRQPRGVARALRLMTRYGVLGAYLPALGQVQGLMQHDLFHVYTVDEHTLRVVRNLRRMADPGRRQELPLCADLMQGRIPKPELLYLAALFHDIAKGRGGDHSALGAAEAEAFCRLHGLSDYDTGLVSWLVREHLLMSTTSQRRDIGDPAEVAAFARRVGDPARLDHLYLLTVADIRATNPTLWNSWRDALLLELYDAAMRVLRRGVEPPEGRAQRAAACRREAQALLAAQGIPRRRVEAVWARVDEEYFLRHRPDEVAWHAQALADLEEAGEEPPLVLLRHRTPQRGTELFIHTRAEPDLFARITATLDRLGLDIVDARILSTRDGWTLDSYIVLERDGGAVASPHRAEEIYRRLRAVARPGAQGPGAGTERPLPRRLRPFRVPTRVRFAPDPAGRCTLVELTALDRPGLLSRVAEALLACGVRLRSARIATFGARAEDLLYVAAPGGGPLGPELEERLRRELVARLEAGLPGRAPAAVPEGAPGPGPGGDPGARPGAPGAA
ncbi:MAG: [protein-PII] uridylyltransferase [Gammaproteobacteria bacterium]|nr:MAG: [protein-PII] uridylyltransferase [Gammaproteobacteria bacterium]